MLISELIKKLENAKNEYGDLEVKVSPCEDAAINAVCFVDGKATDGPIIVLTDDVEFAGEVYHSFDVDITDPEQIIVKEIQ